MMRTAAYHRRRVVLTPFAEAAAAPAPCHSSSTSLSPHSLSLLLLLPPKTTSCWRHHSSSSSSSFSSPLPTSTEFISAYAAAELSKSSVGRQQQQSGQEDEMSVSKSNCTPTMMVALTSASSSSSSATSVLYETLLNDLSKAARSKDLTAFTKAMNNLETELGSVFSSEENNDNVELGNRGSNNDINSLPLCPMAPTQVAFCFSTLGYLLHVRLSWKLINFLMWALCCTCDRMTAQESANVLMTLRIRKDCFHLGVAVTLCHNIVFNGTSSSSSSSEQQQQQQQQQQHNVCRRSEAAMRNRASELCELLCFVAVFGLHRNGALESSSFSSSSSSSVNAGFVMSSTRTLLDDACDELTQLVAEFDSLRDMDSSSHRHEHEDDSHNHIDDVDDDHEHHKKKNISKKLFSSSTSSLLPLGHIYFLSALTAHSLPHASLIPTLLREIMIQLPTTIKNPSMLRVTMLYLARHPEVRQLGGGAMAMRIVQRMLMMLEELMIIPTSSSSSHVDNNLENDVVGESADGRHRSKTEEKIGGASGGLTLSPMLISEMHSVFDLMSSMVPRGAAGNDSSALQFALQFKNVRKKYFDWTVSQVWTDVEKVVEHMKMNKKKNKQPRTQSDGDDDDDDGEENLSMLLFPRGLLLGNFSVDGLVKLCKSLLLTAGSRQRHLLLQRSNSTLRRAAKTDEQNNDDDDIGDDAILRAVSQHEKEQRAGEGARGGDFLSGSTIDDSSAALISAQAMCGAFLIFSLVATRCSTTCNDGGNNSAAAAAAAAASSLRRSKTFREICRWRKPRWIMMQQQHNEDHPSGDDEEHDVVKNDGGGADRLLLQTPLASSSSFSSLLSSSSSSSSSSLSADTMSETSIKMRKLVEFVQDMAMLHPEYEIEFVTMTVAADDEEGKNKSATNGRHHDDADDADVNPEDGHFDRETVAVVEGHTAEEEEEQEYVVFGQFCKNVFSTTRRAAPSRSSSSFTGSSGGGGDNSSSNNNSNRGVTSQKQQRLQIIGDRSEIELRHRGSRRHRTSKNKKRRPSSSSGKKKRNARNHLGSVSQSSWVVEDDVTSAAGGRGDIWSEAAEELMQKR